MLLLSAEVWQQAGLGRCINTVMRSLSRKGLNLLRASLATLVCLTSLKLIIITRYRSRDDSTDWSKNYLTAVQGLRHLVEVHEAFLGMSGSTNFQS